jgi:hypothetical protein
MMPNKEISVMKLLASFVASIAICNAAQAQVECYGCQLYMVVYPDGFYAGHTGMDGVSFDWTPGLETTSGGCVGLLPNCTPSPCIFKKGVVTVGNDGAGGPIDVNHPGGVNRSTLVEGQESNYGVISVPGGEQLACAGHPRTIMEIASGDTVYLVALLCTNCPGSAPY